MFPIMKAAAGGLAWICRARGHPGSLHGHIKVLAAGVKTTNTIPDYRDVVLPEKPKLTFMEKIPAHKQGIKEMKKLRDIQGPAKESTSFTTGEFAIVALGGGYLHWGHIEMIRLTINRQMDFRTTFARWRISAPYKPITRKSLGQRMGGGKGAIDHYVTPIQYGRLIVEVGGKVELGEVKKILTIIAKKLPFPAKVMDRKSHEAMVNSHAEREQNNQNPWTFKQIAQGNMLGSRKVLSPFDLRNHGRFTGRFHFPDRV